MIVYRIADDNDMFPVLKLLEKIDDSFPIPLSHKTNLYELANKFIKNGYVYMAFDGELPVGMIGFYANDMVNKSAYISVIGVLKTHYRRGIAQNLIYEALKICKKNAMTTCVLYTHKTNTNAISMYEKLGFTTDRNTERPNDIKFIKKL